MWSKSITLEVRNALNRGKSLRMEKNHGKLIFEQIGARMWQNVTEFKWSSAKLYEFHIIADETMSTTACRQVLQFTMRKSIKNHPRSIPRSTLPRRIVQKNIAQQRKPDLLMSWRIKNESHAPAKLVGFFAVDIFRGNLCSDCSFLRRWKQTRKSEHTNGMKESTDRAGRERFNAFRVFVVREPSKKQVASRVTPIP